MSRPTSPTWAMFCQLKGGPPNKTHRASTFWTKILRIYFMISTGYGWGQISKSPWFDGSPDGLYHVLFLRFIRSVEIRWDLFTQRHRVVFFWPAQTWVVTDLWNRAQNVMWPTCCRSLACETFDFPPASEGFSGKPRSKWRF